MAVYKIDIKPLIRKESLKEDTVQKANGKWTNRGDDGTEHGEFDTKAEADAQRKAMFASGYKGESLDEELKGKYPWFIGDSVKSDGTGLFLTADGRYKKQHYSQADKLSLEDAKKALSILNSKLKRKTSMNYYLESKIRR